MYSPNPLWLYYELSSKKLSGSVPVDRKAPIKQISIIATLFKYNLYIRQTSLYMDIDINGLIVNRAIMHSVLKKEDHQDHSSTTHSHEIQELSEPIIRVIKDRLINATGKASKAFKLSIRNSGHHTFYNCCHGLNEKNESGFIRASQLVVDLLGESQNKSSIPAGYLLFIECIDIDLPVYIAIKAEPHAALIIPPG